MQGIARAGSALARSAQTRRAVTPHAGPSTLPFRPICTSRPSHYPRSTGPPALDVRSPSHDTVEESGLTEYDSELAARQAIVRSAKEQLDDAFSQRAALLHRAPLGPLDPILLPLSSLASKDPTGPDGSGTAIALPRDIFGERTRRDILHRCVVWFRSAMRQGTHKQKGRSEVAYSGRKLRPQKKTGRARLGDRSNPIMKGGARTFPKRPRNYTQLLNRKIRALGMRVALSLKLEMGLLRCVKSLNEGRWSKTKHAKAALVQRKIWTKDEPEAIGTAQEKLLMIGAPVGAADMDSASEGTDAVEAAGNEADAAEALSSMDDTSDATSTTTDLTTPPANDPTPPAQSITVGFDSGSTKRDLSILFIYPHTKPAADIKAFALPLRNLPGVEVMSTDEVQVYHILKHRWLVLEAGAVDILSLQKGQPQLDELDPEWTDEQLEVGDPKATDFVQADRIGKPQTWLVHRWRKLRGRKSMRKVFGMRYATAVATENKKTWRKIARLGIDPTPDMVAMAIAGKYVRENRTAKRLMQ